MVIPERRAPPRAAGASARRAAAACAAPLAACAMAVVAPTIPPGRWAGTVEHFDRGAYPMAVSVLAHEISVEYPTLGCGGAWIPTGTVRRARFFRESLRSDGRAGAGDCVDGGSVRLTVHEDGWLGWDWFWPDGRHGATATLRRPAP